MYQDTIVFSSSTLLYFFHFQSKMPCNNYLHISSVNPNILSSKLSFLSDSPQKRPFAWVKPLKSSIYQLSSERNNQLIMESKRITKTEDDHPFEKSQSEVEPYQNGPIFIDQSEENSQLESSKQYLRHGGKQSNFEQADDRALDKSDTKNSLPKNKLGLKYGEKVKKIRKNWQPDEQRRYLGFISEPIRQAELEATQKKKKQRIYNYMSSRIQTRSSRQCKSHHQKMIAKYQTLRRAIELLSMELDTTKFYVRQPLKKKKTTLEPEYIV